MPENLHPKLGPPPLLRRLRRTTGRARATDREREAPEFADRVRQIQSGLPAALFAARAASGAAHGMAPPRRMIEAQRYRQHGVRLVERGKFAAAIIALRQAVELDPGDAGSHHALGLALLRSGRFEEAVASLRLAITLKDDLAAAHCSLAAALDGLGRNCEAVVACRRAVALAPQLVEGHRLLGELLEAAGDLTEAAECFRRAASGAPDTTTGRLDQVRAFRGRAISAKRRCACGRRLRSIRQRRAPQDARRDPGQGGALTRRLKRVTARCALNPFQVAAHLTAVRVRTCTEGDRPRLRRMLSTLRMRPPAMRIGCFCISPSANCSMIWANTGRRCGISIWPTASAVGVCGSTGRGLRRI